MSRRRMMLATVRRAAVSVFYRPSGFLGDSFGYWKTRNTSNGVDLNEINEVSPDDSSFLSCGIRTTSSPRITVPLAGGPVPGTISGAILRIRAMKTPNSDQTPAGVDCRAGRQHRPHSQLCDLRNYAHGLRGPGVEL